jgi:hypothetical protein
MSKYICRYCISLPYKCRQHTYIYVKNVSTSVRNLDRGVQGVVIYLNTSVDTVYHCPTSVDNIPTYM